MIRQCAIMVGGLGTRLGALTAETPKPLLPVGGRPFLAWLIREISRFGIDDFLLLTGFRTDRIRAALPEIISHLPMSVRLRLSEEPAPAGTGGALWHARDLLEARFMVCNGDSLFATNLAPLVSWPHGSAEGAIGHLMLRHVADASRHGRVAIESDRVSEFREKQGLREAAWINAGVYAFDRAILDRLSAHCSLEHDALAPLALEQRLTATQGEGYFIDIGIPEDLDQARSALASKLRRPGLFLDRDCVINVDHDCVANSDRFEWVVGARAAICEATRRDWHVFIVASQSGIARGCCFEEDSRALLRWIGDDVRAAGGTIDDARYCSNHAEATVDAYRQVCDCRKPAPGMLLDLIAKWEIDPARALMICGRSSDVEACRAAGVASYQFQHGNLPAFLHSLLDA
jgi:D-glycero-D-manno-heptose 1,7-bisphosphate phosphatase